MTRQRNQQPGDLYRPPRAPTSKLEALEPPSPASLRRPKYLRSHSDSRRSRSGTATSRCEDLDSLCFHNLANDDDGDTMSAYAFSDAGSIVSGRQRSGTTAAALANLATEVDVDSLYQNSAHSLMNDDSLYTSNDPMSRSYQNHHDDLALERAIQQGQRRAQTEARDEVMCPRDHLQWKKATDEAHALHERARNSMEGTLGNGSYRQSKTRSSATTKDLCIQDRKNARRQARLAHANRKHGNSSSKELPSLTGTEESSMSTAPSSTLADSPRQGQQQTRGRRATVHAADGKRSPPLIALDVSSASQPSLMLGRQNSVTTFSSSTWEESATATMSSSTIQPVNKPHRRPPVTNTSKDLAKLDSSNESSGKERGRGRSRSLTRTVVRSISRSLSRTIRKIRGKDDDNKAKKKRSNKCTCPGENIVLKSCPRHGRRAQKLIEETEKKVKKHHHRRSSKRDDLEGSSRKHRHRHHHHHHHDDASGTQEHQPQERGRSRLPSSTNAAIMSAGKAGPTRSRSMAEF